MVLLHATKHLNRWLGPFLLKHGVCLRNRFVKEGTDSPYLDAVLGVSLGQWITALEARDHANDLMEAEYANRKELSLDEEALLRVKVLEDYVRPSLLPNESWGRDVVEHWQFYPRLVRWIRQQYLQARFGPHVQAIRHAYPALLPSPQFRSLPKSSLVEACLCIDGDNHIANKKTSKWSSTKNRAKVVQSMQSVAKRYGGETQIVRGGAFCWNELPPDTSLAKAPLSDVLHLVGSDVQHSGPLNAWLEQTKEFQFWTREYIAGLGDYICQRCRGPTPTTVLEVGAGDGLLTALLEDYVHNYMHNMRTRSPDGQVRENRAKGEERRLPAFIATDDESWSIRKKSTVRKMDYRQALQKFSTGNEDLIILCSWMPMNEDWTAAFREHGNVMEYILIGEADDGQCGDNWQTWGNLDFVDDSDGMTVSPYTAEGFTRHDLSFLLPYQFSRYDSSISKEGTTVSFRRQV